MLGKNKKTLSVVALVIIIVLLWANAVGDTTSVNEVVDGTYKMEAAGQEQDAVCMHFDAGTMTYVTEMTSEEETYTIDSGSYAVEDGVIYTFSEVDDANSLMYTLEGDSVVVVE